jgi:ABC-type transport system involved in multi-copper enzyme maturation permease subunit
MPNMRNHFRFAIYRTSLGTLGGAATLISALFGAMMRFELVRSSRRGRFHALRIAFLLLLLLFLRSSYRASHFSRWAAGRYACLGGGALAVYRRDITHFAESFFLAFLCMQFAAVLLLTPVALGGAIAEEKHGRRLEFLLATGLSDLEIILGKLAAGVGQPFLIVLAGLPVLALMQFWGGIEPSWVLAGYAATAILMLSVGALTVLCSVHARLAREAVVTTYLVMIALAIVSQLCRFATRRSVFGLSWPAWIADGNILIVLYQLRAGWLAGKPVATVLPGLCMHFVAFHGLLTLVCVTAAALRLRRMAWSAFRPASWRWMRVPLPRYVLTRWPMLWKEAFAERSFPLGRTGWVCVCLILLASLVPVGRKAWDHRQGAHLYSEDLRDAIEIWGRLLFTGGAGLALIGVAVHAASSISRERERRSLDNFLMTSLTAGEILFSKWLGSILTVRRIGLVLVVLWTVSAGLSGSRFLVLIAFVAAWLLYACCFATLALWFSVSRQNTRQATLWTLAVMMGVSLAHYAPWFFIRELPAYLQLPRAISLGMTPAACLHWLALSGDGLDSYSSLFRRFTSGEYALVPLIDSPGKSANVIVGVVVGLLLWLASAAALWFLAKRKFCCAREHG